jgi:insulysin
MFRRSLCRMSRTLETPGFDQREYGQLVLENKIVATLISDRTLTRSSCALAVDVGASDDPHEYPGLAHFTEHMLFLGTQKYPKENHYKDFLNTHGGSSNASTSMETTVYRFDVNSTHFAEALDIFSQFFKQPLFSPESASREIKAVDAEDSKNRQLDGRRTLQILKCLVNPSHPYSKFSTGNITTLAKGDPEGNAQLLREQMKAFYHTFYLSRSMGVAVAGPQPLAELEALAKEHFSDILHNPAPKAPSSFELSPDCLQKGQEIFVNPVREIHDLSILWVLPSLRSGSLFNASITNRFCRTLYRSDPCRFMSFLLGHEGEGSIFSNLQVLHQPLIRSPPSRHEAGPQLSLLGLEHPFETFLCFRFVLRRGCVPSSLAGFDSTHRGRVGPQARRDRHRLFLHSVDVPGEFNSFLLFDLIALDD